MARNMYVTVVADTKSFSRNMKGAAQSVSGLERVVNGAGKLGVLAFASMAVAAANIIPDMLKAGEESAKMNKRLEKMVENTGQFEGSISNVTDRLSEYANQTMLATGADDESVKAIQSKLLMFGSLAKSADEAGGAMDRATLAVVDLAAVGMGSAVQAATRLGKLLENPVKNFLVLSKAGIQFTDVQKDHIKLLEDTNKHWEAQDYILDIIEGKVGGLARSQISSLDLLKLRFDEMGESIGEALLPAVEAVAEATSAWLDSPKTKTMFDGFVGDIEDFADWVASPEGAKIINDFLVDVGDHVGTMYDAFKNFVDWIDSPAGKKKIEEFGKALEFISDVTLNIATFFNSDGWQKFIGGGVADWVIEGKKTDAFGNPIFVPSTTGAGTSSEDGDRRRMRGVTVNFNAPVDSVSAGREVARVLADYNRVNGGI